MIFITIATIITIVCPQIDRIRTLMFPPDDDDAYHVQVAAAAAAAADACCSCRCHRFSAGSAIEICRLAEEICLECLVLFKISIAVEGAHGRGVAAVGVDGGDEARFPFATAEATPPSSLPISSASLSPSLSASAAPAVPSFAPRSLSSGDAAAPHKTSAVPLLSDNDFDR